MNRIHYTNPSITDLEADYANDVASNGWGEGSLKHLAEMKYE